MNRCPFTAYFDRNPEDINGLFTVQDHDGGKLFNRLPARSGQPGFTNTSWIRGKSPIPYSGELNSNELKIWLKKPQQFEQWPKASGIGEFWAISNSDDMRTIRGISKDFIRQDIGLHPENMYKGSAGCIVLVHDTADQIIQVVKLHKFLLKLIGQYDYLPLIVL